MTDELPILDVAGIRKSFSGVEVLHGVNLQVHPGQVVALLGENGAGKSTLVKILAGDYRPDSGVVTVLGREFANLNPALAKSLGIRMIFQELNDAADLTVAENIFLGEWPNRRGFVDWRTLQKGARDALDQLGTDIDIHARMSELRVGERQLIEIARAIRAKAKVLILDEPTAALSSAEVDQLFDTVRAMRDRGVGMIYITHRLDEVLAIADTVKVLRDGVVALDSSVAKVDRTAIVNAMIGRETSFAGRPSSTAAVDQVVLAVESLCCEDDFSDVSFRLRRGEILALYGKIGSGTAEVAESIFGLKHAVTGTVTVNGVSTSMKSPSDAIQHGIGFLPPDRQRSGSFSGLSVAENLAAPSWSRMSRGGFLSRKVETAAYGRWRERLGIRSTRDSSEAIVTLSGGNQQKVLLARWLERGVNVLLLVEPTRGVDVGARADIYTSIQETAKSRGLAVLMVTSDYEEVVQLADRAIVMVSGRQHAELDSQQITATALTAASGG